MEYSEKTIKSEEIFNGRVIRVCRDEVLLENGVTSTRELVYHPGGVGIVAYDKDGYVYMVRQYRKPFEEIILEIPAGKLEYGEDHFECGKRELSEETGFTAEKYTYLGHYYATPGFCSEKLHLYLAEGLTAGETHFDSDERLSVEKYKLEDLIKMIDNGEIKDAKTVIALQKVYIMKNIK